VECIVYVPGSGLHASSGEPLDPPLLDPPLLDPPLLEAPLLPEELLVLSEVVLSSLQAARTPTTVNAETMMLSPTIFIRCLQE
jgi:hypothetical protein